MKTILALVGAAAIIAALAGTNFAGINPGASEGAIDATLGTGYVQANKLVNDATPWFSIRLDDGRDDQYEGPGGVLGVAYAFLAYEVPITLALNYNNLGTAGFMTVAEVQEIVADFIAAGVPIEIAQHTDNNLSEGDAMTYEELIDNIDPTELESAFGLPVRVMAQPGDALPFARENRAAIESLCDSVGIKYWDNGYGGADYNPHTNWGSHVAMDQQNNPPAGLGVTGSLYPGVSKNPLWMPSAVTVDLGNFVVERAAVATGDYQYSGFTVLADGTTDPVADYDTTFRGDLHGKLAQNWGGVYACHDSITTPTDAGEVSYLHMAKILDQMRDAGYLNLGTVYDTYEWATSRYAPGTDLINNRKCAIPMYAIGDTVGVEYGLIQGWGFHNGAGASWTREHGASNWANGTNAKFARSASLGDGWPGTDTGPSVEGFRGYDGGLRVSATLNNIYLYRTQLPEGRYEFRLYNTDHRIQLKELGTAIVGKYIKTTNGSLDLSKAFGDTLITVWWKDANQTITAGGTTSDMVWPIRFNIDGRFGTELIGDAGGQFPTATQQTFYNDPLWISWQGGFWIDLGIITACTISAELIYLGPLD